MLAPAKGKWRGARATRARASRHKPPPLVFGFHFALLDVREHADVHSAAIDEILRELHVQAGYAELPEAGRIAVLRARSPIAGR